MMTRLSLKQLGIHPLLAMSVQAQETAKAMGPAKRACCYPLLAWTSREWLLGFADKEFTFPCASTPFGVLLSLVPHSHTTLSLPAWWAAQRAEPWTARVRQAGRKER